jgi:shikimate dehydrogenase
LSTATDLKALQACIRNRLEIEASQAMRLAGILGDTPSQYAKSPLLWNRVFSNLQMDAIYLPFDVDDARLEAFARAMRECEALMGVNVTVPYKVKIMDYLDAIDEPAQRIRAVNTIVRGSDGHLVGYNTDGKGFVDSLIAPTPAKRDPFVDSLAELDVLTIGAGGSARAVAFQLAEAVEKGQIFIANRNLEAAKELANEINQQFRNATALKEDEIASAALQVALIVNCTTKGQGGARHLPDGKITVLEPYSALAPANPTVFPESEYRKPGFHRAWLSASLSDIEANNRASYNLALAIPLDVAFCDLVYHPAETVFLRHGRLSGHRTLNGKGMIIAQAVESFFYRICRDHLRAMGLDHMETYRRIGEIMHEAWAG